jgi:hypothetical protein
MKTICPGNFAQVVVAALTCALLTIAAVRADEIKVVTSATFKPAYLKLVPEYERATHDVLITEYGPSMGTTHNAIPMRLISTTENQVCESRKAHSNYEDALGRDRIAERIHFCRTL